MEANKKLIISVDIKTTRSIEDISKAVIKGLYYGFDVRSVAAPMNVKINYCQETHINHEEGAERLRKIVEWMNSRNEHLNQNKNYLDLIEEFDKIK